MRPFIHTSAQIALSAEIDPTAWIGPNVIIEDRVIIGPYCVIGAPAEYRGKEHIQHGVHIGRDTRITGLVTIDSGTDHPTLIGRDCYIMKHAHVGHDASIHDYVTISCGAKIGGHCSILRGANIGLNAVIHQKKIVNIGCMIGAGAVVTKKLDTEPFKTYAGVPAKLIGQNDKHPDYIIFQKQMFDGKDYH